MNWMNVALDMAKRGMHRQEVPVGAVIVYKERLMAKAHNQVERWQSPLAHAEILTLLQAQKKMKSKYLMGCQMYVTLEPCHLCRAALALCRLDRVYFGAYETTSFQMPCMMGGFSERQAQELLRHFFQSKRT